MNIKTSTPTIVEPTGVPLTIDISSPAMADTTDIILDAIVTDLKVLNILIADITGNIIKADIRSEPTRFIASTMITAVSTDMIRLYLSAFVPVALAKPSSNVTANILL